LDKQTDTVSKFEAISRATSRTPVAGLPRPSPVRSPAVGSKRVTFGQCPHVPEIVHGQHRAAGGVFKADQPGPGKVRVVRLDGGLDGGERNRGIGRVLQGLGLNRAQHGHSTGLPAVRMPLLADDRLVAPLAVGQKPDEVGLGTGACEHRSLEAEQLGSALFQGVYGRILTVDVVSDLGLNHGFAHRRGGAGDGIASKIAHASQHNTVGSDLNFSKTA
jgi:hypothetical protein